MTDIDIDICVQSDQRAAISDQANAAAVSPDRRSPIADRQIAAAVIGGTGYAGAELVTILQRHRGANLVASWSSAFTLSALDHSRPEVVFLATPNEVSNELVPQLLDRGLRVIDLSGAFRLSESALYPTWYGFASARPELLQEAVYGLTEWCNGELKNARLVANPGCYPTSILLALRPLTFILDREQAVICDSKSGVSGAGKKADVEWSFAEVACNFKAYGVGTHRHEPEIRQGLRLGQRAPLVFVPHLLPTVRGILSTMHVAFAHAVTDQEIAGLFDEAYANAPFVRVLQAGKLPELKSVVNTPRAEIGWQLLHGGRRAVVVSVIDNLLKGAASQAVQNFNRMYGYAETEGLL
ncbi:MAG TPA: N-acetyl-gamma-glutamyl-phosphate reductase [Thermoanaerobaculia bacterium]|jgi:N-acetyl-gamma-glutamyl-phosphate reductase|nr:N-acetyl-gamma-glutamyl-phosphate reductase [Thermoanaerobaculia bacterium]